MISLVLCLSWSLWLISGRRVVGRAANLRCGRKTVVSQSYFWLICSSSDSTWQSVSAIDPNRSITELKSSHSTPACCGSEVLRSLECVGHVAAHRGSSSARRPVSASKSVTWPWSFNRPAWQKRQPVWRSPEEVLQRVARLYGFAPPSDLVKPTRRPSEARQVAL